MNRRILFCIVIGLLFVSSSTGSTIIKDENIVKRSSEDLDKEQSNKITYEGNQLWRVKLNDPEEKDVVLDLMFKEYITTWGGNQSHVDILIQPTHLNEVQEALNSTKMTYTVIIKNLQELIDSENPQDSEDNEDRQGHRMNWNAYHRLADIYGYLDYLSQTYPDLCTVTTIGLTYETRPIKLLKISNGRPGNKAVWIDGGIHAREWISPASVTYIINYIIEKYDKLGEHIRNMDFYIVPVLNPDGYEYSHKVERLWRKNRSPFKLNSGRYCYGTDLNRNFGYFWGGKGISFNPCSDTYAGTKAYSELETQAVKKFMEGKGINWKAYITYHSYGQYILYPWGYDEVKASDHNDLTKVARKAQAAIKRVGGPNYTIGPAGSTLYPAAGGSDDWAKGYMNLKYSYTVELQDLGRYGFVLPASYIKRAAMDAVQAMLVISEAAYKL